MNGYEIENNYNFIFQAAKKHTKYKKHTSDKLLVSNIIDSLKTRMKILDIVDFISLITVIISIIAMVFCKINPFIRIFTPFSIVILFLIEHYFYKKYVTLYTYLSDELIKYHSLKEIICGFEKL